ncbi:MAG TPA: hypothetical protein VL284_07040 [Thermoanaerobaculia bacterium]|nr:hypothetical protein [Thermoanaerobaculia bacterium]
MTIAAAVDITAPDQDALIAAAATFAHQRGERCFIISVVRSIEQAGQTSRDTVQRNLALITARDAAPIVQEGDDVARTLRKIAEEFGVETLFVQNGKRRFGRTIAEQLVRLKPPFEIVVVNRSS